MRKTLPIIAFLLSVALQICAQQKNYDFKEGKLFYKITDATKQRSYRNIVQQPY